jgi:GNAT superfamily N-acetyltransferase
MALAPEALVRGGTRADLREARAEDYAFLYQAGAELRCEELLEDPREVDPIAYARRVQEECRDGWTWVLRDANGLSFRAGLSALTSDAAQVSGVWVPPALRGQGLATRAMRATVWAPADAQPTGVPVRERLQSSLRSRSTVGSDSSRSRTGPRRSAYADRPERPRLDHSSRNTNPRVTSA